MDIRPEWDEYFIEIAKVVSKRSTCIRRKYGAVIVKNNKIISTGYNGSPKGAINCIDSGVCAREVKNIPKGERYELCESVHAEQNAIIQASLADMQDSTIYIFGFEPSGEIATSTPCLLCQRMIKNAGITKVVCFDENKKLCLCWENTSN